jgi:hypothetical protein
MIAHRELSVSNDACTVVHRVAGAMFGETMIVTGSVAQSRMRSEVHFTDIRGVDLSPPSQPPFQCILALFKHRLIVYSMSRIHCSWANFAGTL